MSGEFLRKLGSLGCCSNSTDSANTIGIRGTTVLLLMYSVPGLAMRSGVMEIISTSDQADTVPCFSRRRDSEKPVLPGQRDNRELQNVPEEQENDNGTAGCLRGQDIQAV